jgi:hypothetical protein
LNRTSVVSPTNNKIFTISFLVKRGVINDSAFENILGGSTSQQDTLGFGSGTNNGGDSIQLRDSSVGSYNLLTTQVFRDPAAWYQFVVSVDTTQATASNRIKIYANGTQITAFTTATYPAQNYVFEWNSASTASVIGRRSSSVSSFYLDGYLTEINFIDGQALTPSSFGSTNPATSVWQPKAYTGTYGTNGFYLPFTDNSALTTSSNVGLGKDFSGNGNYWTTNNISLTAGVTYDSMTDVPTLTSASASNFAVLNPLGNNGGTVLDGNINHTGTTALTANTLFPSTGKWYCEMFCTAYGGGATLGYAAVGVIQSTQTLNTVPTSVASVPAGIWEYRNDAIKINNGSSASYGNTWTANDLIGIAFDVDAGKVWFAKNNTWQASGDPAAGTNAAYTNLSGSIGVLINDFGTYSNSFAANFGQRPFTYTPPSGFVALNTYNIAAGAVTTSGSFTGNLSADGPFVYLNGVPTAMTINGNAVTFGTNVDKLSNGFKVRSASALYNLVTSNTYSVTTNGAVFKNANAQGNP